jgi:hypothetical protein
LEQIDKDVRRTLPDFAFFQLPVPKSPLNPLSPPNEEEEVVESKKETEIADEQNEKAGRFFPFGLGRRPRSSSTASRKSNKSIKGNRSRSNSKSSVRSIGSGAAETNDPLTKISSPLNMVRRFSHALKGGSGPLQMDGRRSAQHRQKEIDYTKYESYPRILNRRSLFKRIAHLNMDFGAREHQDLKRAKSNKAATTADPLSPSDSPNENDEVESKLDNYKIQDLHWEAIERLLFIYVKLNPGVGYVQGMNELLGPIYYVFAQDSDDVEAQAHAEADSFFVFSLLMSDVRDHFTRTLDHDASTGINATMTRMSDRLRWINPKLWKNLTVDKEIKEQFYAFRWITVLYTQEWDLPDVIRIWDSLLADRCMQSDSTATASPGIDRFQFLLDFCVAMVV